VNNVYLIYGEDTLRSKTKLEAIKDRYRAKFSDLEIISLYGTEVSFEELEGKLFASAMFVSRKLVILVNFLSEGSKRLTEQLATRIEQVPETTVVVFYEQGAVDRRLALFKKLNRPGFAENLRPLAQPELINWIKSEVSRAGGSISPDAAANLALWFGPDTWRIHQELTKLLTLGGAIDQAVLIKLVTPDEQSNVFELLDQLFTGQKQQVLSQLRRLISSGQPLLQLIATIAGSVRNLILVKEATEQTPYLSSGQLARRLQIHPFVAQKALRVSRLVNGEDLNHKLGLIQKIDRAIKTGKIEQRVALELLVAQLVER